MLDLMEKGLRPPDQNDWMTAYEIEGHPGLHLTHHYFKDLSLSQVEQVLHTIKNHFDQHPLQAKQIVLNQEEKFGPDKDIRVLANDQLVPHLDPELKTKLNGYFPSKFASYRPHVTTETHPEISGKIKRFYLQRGDGKTLFSTDAINNDPNLQKGENMPSVNVKVEGIEVKKPLGNQTKLPGVASSGMPSMTPKIPTAPKLSPMTSTLNNTPKPSMQKAAPMMVVSAGQQTASAQPRTLDYSKHMKPVDSHSGSVKPIHNPIQHMQKANDPKFERCVMDVKAEGKPITEKNPWAICHASLGKAEGSCLSLERLQKLRKCMALKKDTPVFMRD
jgi:hypothetical protein